MSANSRLVDERLQKLRGGGTRFSEKVKSYLTARFDVDTETGRKPDLSEVATDMRTSRNTGSSRTFQKQMAYKGTSSIILFQTDCNQQEKKGWPKPRKWKFVTNEWAAQCSCKKKLRFLLMNVETRRSNIFSTRWTLYIPSGTMAMISASRPTKTYSRNSMWKHLRIFWTVVQILRYKGCSNKHNNRHGERMQLLPHHPVNGQGLANCLITLGWAEVA